MAKKISVSYNHTANLGNYESAKVQIGGERDLKPDEDFTEATDEEFEECFDIVMEKIETIKGNK